MGESRFLIRNSWRAGVAVGSLRLWTIVIISLFVNSISVADAPPPPCEDPCSAGCPMEGELCCTLTYPGGDCCPTGAQGELDCNNNNILDPCEVANCISESCDGDDIPDGCDTNIPSCEYEKYYYDALGRRIGKKVVNHCDNTETKQVYYYDAENVILETLRNGDGTDTPERYFVHGNQYIDERVLMHNIASNPANDEEYYYMEKELHSVSALMDNTGAPVESYSYDTYGNVRIWDVIRANGNERDSSSLGNPYYFTGRRMDFVKDTASANPKQVYHYRARAYDPVHGRFMQRDPLGMREIFSFNNEGARELVYPDAVFERPTTLYSDGMSLYQYGVSNPVDYQDPTGLSVVNGGIINTAIKMACGNVCGPDVTKQVISAIGKTRRKFNRLKPAQQRAACSAFTSFAPDPLKGNNPMYLNAWDIIDLHNQAWINSPPYTPVCATAPNCVNTVEVNGQCFYAGSVNYVIFGHIWRLCKRQQTDGSLLIWLYKGSVPVLRPAAAGNYLPSQQWFKAGYSGWPNAGTPPADRPKCMPVCPVKYQGAPFAVYWGTIGTF